ncbi:hypothetical protein [Roseivirga pacifica]|uniref:hypothetical protein n=1 Tax=Roseivirga pacifica TaxID=1267423 RepID=UPI003BB0139A
MHPLLGSGMDFHVEVLSEVGVISGKVEGDLTLVVAREYLKQVNRAIRDSGVERIVSDLRSSSVKINKVELESLSKELVQLGTKKVCRRAIVLSGDVNVYKQWENLNLREGFHYLKLFVDKDQAMEWLVEH